MEDRLSTRWGFPFKRFIVVPAMLMLRALKEMIISYGWGYAGAFLLGLLGLYGSKFLSAPYQPSAQLTTTLLNLFVLFTLVFAAPSTYCSAGTNAKHVTDAKDALAKWKVDTGLRVDLVLKNMKVFEDRVKRRLVIFRWILGVAWTLWFSPLLADAIKEWTAGGFSLMRLAMLFTPFAWLMGSFLVVEAYARGVDILFRSIELGCNERSADIARANSLGQGVNATS